VQLTDHYDGTNSTTLEIEVNAENLAPSWSKNPFSQPDAEVGTNYVRWLNHLVDDPEGDPTTMAKVSGPDWLDVTNPSPGKIEGVPTVADPGTNVFVLSITDGMHDPVEATMTIFIPGEPNLAPFWKQENFFSHVDAVADEGYSRWLKWRATDPNGDTKTFAIVSGPTWLSMDTNGHYYGTPSAADVGTNEFVISVADEFHDPVETTMRQIVLSPAGGKYLEWLGEGTISSAGAGYFDDPDSDGVPNLMEYALGGNPTNGTDNGSAFADDIKLFSEDGVVKYVYPVRNDADARGLVYSLESTPDLPDGIWSNGTYPILGTGVLDSEFDAVTNEIPADGTPYEYLRLKVEIQ
jgi:hypothetical protein